MDLNEAYDQIWVRKLADIHPPDRQSIDRVNWTSELFPKEASAGPLFDMGTGSGAMLARAARMGWKVAGCDLSQKVARWLGGMGYDVWTLDANRERVPLEDGSVGVVTLCDVIEHLTDPGFALKEAHRLLRPGGILYVATPNCALWRRIQSLAQGRMFRTSGDPELRDGGHLAYYAPADLREFIQTAGFGAVQLTLRKADPCPPHIWFALQAMGSTNREWHEFTYMVASAVRP